MELLFLFIEWLSMVAYQGLRDLEERSNSTGFSEVTGFKKSEATKIMNDFSVHFLPPEDFPIPVYRIQ